MSIIPIRSPHTFHIPVMGTGFTIDTPLHVAPYGISSVISIGDDHLIEKMREYHARQAGEDYEPIPHRSEDARARRITAYLDLLDRLVRRRVQELRNAPFSPGSLIHKYFEMLPDSPLRDRFVATMNMPEGPGRLAEQEALREHVVAGSIDVNILTKADLVNYHSDQPFLPESTNAMSSLRGFAKSALRSSIVLSAGINPKLYSYMAQFDDFLPDADGRLKKGIILKVSDYHSAYVQGKYLAKRGLWISEVRVESGLNCGGHAFPSRGYLLGPILDELREKRTELIDDLRQVYCVALKKLGRLPHHNTELPSIRVTVQGGIGTQEEDHLLRTYYKVDGTGWATPFLLVPEVVSIDDSHVQRLCQAGEKDVRLSEASPFGIPFWLLNNSDSENNRRELIEAGRPGSGCPRGFLRFHHIDDMELPVCAASRPYLKTKIEILETDQELSPDQCSSLKKSLLAKACLCRDLAASALLKYNIETEAAPTVCPGPNIVNFSRIASLQEMVAHIYGRLSLITNPERPHMFIRELSLYVDYLKEELQKHSLKLSDRTPKYFQEFRENMLNGVESYRKLAQVFIDEKKAGFMDELERLRNEIEMLLPETASA